MAKTTNSVETVNVRLPDEVISLLDRLVDKRFFSSRSEAVREFCRQFIEEQR